MLRKVVFRQRQQACRYWIVFATLHQIARVAKATTKKRFRYQQFIIQQTLLQNQVAIKHPDELEAESEAERLAEEAELQEQARELEAEKRQKQEYEAELRGENVHYSTEMLDSISQQE